MSSAEQPALGEADMDKATAVDDDKPTFHVVHSDSGGPAAGLALWQAQDIGYDTIMTSITTAYFHSRILKLLASYVSDLDEHPARGGDLPVPTISPILSEDTTLTPTRDASQLVGYTSPWIDLFSPDPMIADISRQVLMMEVTYAAFCGVHNIIITGPGLYGINLARSDDVAQYARAVQEVLLCAPFVQLAIHIPMCYQTEAEKEPLGHLTPFAREAYTKTKAETDVGSDSYGSWDSWNVIRTVCQYSPRLTIALLIPREIPSESLQSRWFAEPLGFLSFTAATFLPNNKGQLLLSKDQQSLIFRYMCQHPPPWILLYDTERSNDPKESKAKDGSSSTPPEADDLGLEKTQTHMQLLAMHLRCFRLLQRHQPPKIAMEKFGSGYEDYLQPPMQPLSENLDSRLYEGIERDPIKYEWYGRAITHALTDWEEKKKSTSGPDKRVVIAVAGLGRGPLVMRALRASDTAKVPVEIWAVEKNPQTYVILEQHNKHDWAGVVNIVHSDMREWKGPTRSSPDAKDETIGKVDILVSELLGSFADNELSPECLDGIQHVLAPHGISIPSSYSAHLTPIIAPRLHGQISRAALTNPMAYDTAYCVYLHAISYLATSVPSHPYIQQAWEFVHPLPSSILTSSEARANKHNARHSRLKFTCENRGVVSGIAGYLEIVLYDGGRDKLVELSTRPDTIDEKSKDMLSWFPMYFPLKNPLYFPDNTELEISMSRQTDGRKVWYEWLVEAFVINEAKKRIRLGMSDVGSNRIPGYVM